MGSKKKRHAEKLAKKNSTVESTKKEQKTQVNKEPTKEEKNLKSKKVNAIINILILITLLIMLMINSTMNKTIGFDYSNEKVAPAISKNIKSNATVLDTAYAEGRAYSIYKNTSNDNIELMNFGRHKFLFNRFIPVESISLPDNKGYAVKTFELSEYPDKVDIVIYGSLSNSKVKSVEISYDSSTEKIDINNPESFVSLFTLNKVEDANVSVKFLDANGEDITSEI